MDLFDTSKKPYINVCAPMVRYSKLEFRSLVRKYNCDLCFTPMIMADSFIKSKKARNNEFTTNSSDTPLIVQFATNNPEEFASAAELVSPHSDGVDLNCGCPQRWAMKLGVGAQMLYDPDSIKNAVRQVRNRVRNDFSVSVKMRILENIRSSVELCQQLERAGVDFLTIHGRTKDQKCEPNNVEAIRTIVSSVRIPVIANGDVKCIQEADEMHAVTGCRGVMVARGILQNPSIFSGSAKTPAECVRDWISIALENNLYFVTFHHHLVFMLEKVIDFLNDYYGFEFSCLALDSPVVDSKKDLWQEFPTQKGKFFLEKTEPDMFLDELFV